MLLSAVLDFCLTRHELQNLRKKKENKSSYSPFFDGEVTSLQKRYQLTKAALVGQTPAQVRGMLKLRPVSETELPWEHHHLPLPMFPPGRTVASVWRQGHCPHVTCLTNGFLAVRTITLFTELLGLVHLLNTSEYWHRANAGQHVVEHCIKTLDFSFHTAVVSNSLEPVNSLPSSLGGFQYPLRGTALVLRDHSLTELWLLAPYACKNKNKKNTTLQALVA